MLCFLILFTIVSGVSLWFFMKKGNPEPIFGVYRQPSRWFYFKYLIFLAILYLRKFQKKELTEAEIAALESATPLSAHPLAFDAVFYSGANNKGYYLMMGTERRKRGIVNGLFYLVIPGKGLLQSPKLPDTLLFPEEDLGYKGEGPFGAEGILSEPVTPMRNWKLRYEGKMRYQSNPEELVDVIFEGNFVSKLKHFNYGTDLHPPCVARSIAREVWTRDYFYSLKVAHQSHYEQMGDIKGKLTVNGEEHEINVQSFRDHSTGFKRDWKLMHRYAFFSVFLDDGSYACIGIICQPCTNSTLETGYVVTPSKETIPIEWCDFQLYQHGEEGTPPTDHALRFGYGQEEFTLQINVEHQNIHYVGSNWEARMVERFCRYLLNGVPGRGFSEFHYRHIGGRPESVANADPNWYKHLRLKEAKYSAYSQ